jgi:hypothetical protein
MRLQAALGCPDVHARQREAARVALSRSLAIAEERDDPPHQLRMLALLHTFHHRIGEFRRAMRFARRGAAVRAAAADPADDAVARSALGSSLHHAGDLAGARSELEAVLRHAPGPRRTGMIYLGFDHHIYAGVALARTLWLQGHPVQAVRRARQTVQDAARMDHPATLSIALAWALTVFIWAGDFDAATSIPTGSSRMPSRIRWRRTSRSAAASKASSPSAAATRQAGSRACKSVCGSWPRGGTGS